MNPIKRLFRKINPESIVFNIGLYSAAIVSFVALCDITEEVDISKYVYIIGISIFMLCFLIWLILTKPKTQYK